jgi:hypothetical protein
MAVVQISKIQIRRGLQENLPQLASAEMGWSIDERRLFIGNGTLAEGAPTTGVTEILTAQTNAGMLVDISVLQGNVIALESADSLLQSNIGNLQATVNATSITLTDNSTTATNTAISLSSLASNTIDYSILRGTTSRVGTLKVTQLAGTAMYEDDYVESADTGVALAFTSNVTSVILTYTTTSTGDDATFNYYLKPFN